MVVRIGCWRKAHEQAGEKVWSWFASVPRKQGFRQSRKLPPGEHAEPGREGSSDTVLAKRQAALHLHCIGISS